MKKILSFLMLTAIVAFSSCNKQESTDGSGNETTARISVQLPNQATQTRAAFANPQLNNMRLIFMLISEGQVIYSEPRQLTGAFGTQTFEFRVIMGKPYTVSIWSDFGTGYYDVVSGVGTAPKVTMKTPAGSDNKYDAYFKVQDITFNQTNLNNNFELKRPFGLIKINATDYNEPVVKIGGFTPTNYVISNIKVPTELNLLDGSAQNPQIKTVAGACATTNSAEISFDYFFAPATQATLADFTVEFKNPAKGTISSVDMTNIPIRRNYITNIFGNLFTKSGSITVTIAPDWEGNLYEGAIVITNDTELKDALQNQAAGQVWILKEGNYNLDRTITAIYDGTFNDWYMPITANDITIIGEGVVNLTSDVETPNGNWHQQNFITVIGNNVTIDGIKIKSKLEANKAIEVLGNNFTLKNSQVINSDYADYAGAVYFSNTANDFVAKIENCILNNSPIATSTLVAGAKVIINNVTSNFDASYANEWNATSADFGAMSANASSVFQLDGAFIINLNSNMVNAADVLSKTTARAPAGTVINSL